MASVNPSFLTEASNIAKDSVNAVNIVPSLIVGFIVFIVIMYLVVYIASVVKSDEDKLTYNTQGCKLDSSGKAISTPIYSSVRGQANQIVGYDNCVTRTSSLTIYGIGTFVSIALAVIAGSSIYKAQFYIANPKLAAGLYATDMLLGRK